MKRIILIVGIFLLLLAAGGGASIFWVSLQNKPVHPFPEDGNFTISSGEAANTTIERLYEGGFIRSPLFMKLAGKILPDGDSFKKGQYIITEGMTSLQIRDLLISGKQILKRVTVAEGLTLRKISQVFENSGIVTSEEFLAAASDKSILRDYGIPADTAAGYLYPDTYLFAPDYPADKIVRHMIDRFFGILAEIKVTRDNHSDREIFDAVRLASIIEREYRVAAEAKVMASVFLNRIDIDMPLGSCATVEYVITEELGKPHPTYLTWDDVALPSLYNTYLKPGLPPGPISAPGKVALNAVFFPAKTDFLFFVLRDPKTGEHFFSKTYDEHNRAKVLYLKS